MTKGQVAIIGYGYVGKAMHKIFPNALVYDVNMGSQDEVNEKAELAIICVPTPSKEDGFCDTSVVEEMIGWLDDSETEDRLPGQLPEEPVQFTVISRQIADGYRKYFDCMWKNLGNARKKN